MNEEPKLPEDWWLRSNPSSFVEWHDWAVAKMMEIEKDFQESKQKHEEEKFLTQQRVSELLCEASAKDVKLKEQDEAIKGFEAWQRLRKNSVETYEIGAEVFIGPQRIRGKIDYIVLSKGRTEYGVSYWYAGAIHKTRVQADEVELFDEPLRLPKEDYGT